MIFTKIVPADLFFSRRELSNGGLGFIGALSVLYACIGLVCNQNVASHGAVRTT